MMDLSRFEVAFFKALAHPLRLRILKKLCTDELCVCQLNKDVVFSQSNISQHLRILKEADLVVQRKDGLNVYYSVRDKRLINMIKLANDMIIDRIKEYEEAIPSD